MNEEKKLRCSCDGAAHYTEEKTRRSRRNLYYIIRMYIMYYMYICYPCIKAPPVDNETDEKGTVETQFQNSATEKQHDVLSLTLDPWKINIVFIRLFCNERFRRLTSASEVNSSSLLKQRSDLLHWLLQQHLKTSHMGSQSEKPY